MPCIYNTIIYCGGQGIRTLTSIFVEEHISSVPQLSRIWLSSILIHNLCIYYCAPSGTRTHSISVSKTEWSSKLPTGAGFVFIFVPLMGFEPIASQGLNLSGLPVAYRGFLYQSLFSDLEWITGLEPTSPRWHPGTLPLSYIHIWCESQYFVTLLYLQWDLNPQHLGVWIQVVFQLPTEVLRRDASRLYIT